MLSKYFKFIVLIGHVYESTCVKLLRYLFIIISFSNINFFNRMEGNSLKNTA